MTILVIVESPAKAKTIGNFLGKKYRVEASFGHVRDLPSNKKEVPEEFKGEKWADFAVNVEDRFQPIYIIPDDKKRHIANLKKAMKDADELLLATDEDREGESISWHLQEILQPKVPVKRIVFHEITREAITEAIANPRELDEDLVHAQEARRVLDRLFGYKLSPVLWRKVQPGLSAGRVQSAAVRLLVEREEERRRFVSSQYWDLEAEIGSDAGPFKATLVSIGGKRLATGKDFDSLTGLLASKNVHHFNEKDSAALATRLEGALPWTVSRVEDKPATQRPSPPFTTSTLQQEANRKLGFGAKRTMQIAQKLYEGVDLGDGERTGLITYMRTDSVTLSDKALREGQQAIRSIYGADYAQGSRVYTTKARNAQEAHEAIRPTDLMRRPQDVKSYLEREELAVYELIWKRTIASQMPDARLERTIVEISAKNENNQEAIFTASGKKILFPGYLRAYVEGSDDPNAEIGDQEVILPDVKVGQLVYPAVKAPTKKDLTLQKLANRGHETSPPARYSEASLVKKLEEEGIGRPSTYASIISTIQDRGYCFLNKSRQLIPTFVAMAVIQLLRDHFSDYVDLKFTARMEEELDQISNGQLKWEKQISQFFRGSGKEPGLEALVDSKQKSIGFPDLKLGDDPESGLAVTVRIGKYGPYIMRGENGNATMADLPKEMPPAELKLDEALRLLKNKQAGPRQLGADPVSGLAIQVFEGRFGAYVQLGDASEEKKAPKPRRASLDQGTTAETVTLEQALKLLAFPKKLGKHPESGDDILVNKGKFGPYVQHQSDFRSLKKTDDLHTITFERALELIMEPKAPRRGAEKTVLRDLGEGLQVLEGRYGSYITDGKANATVPKDVAIESLTLEVARQLLGAKSKGGAKKGTAGKRTAKAADAPAKKAVAKKAPAKKPAAKKTK